MTEQEIEGAARTLAARPYTITTEYDAEDGYFVARAEEYPFFAGAEDTPEAAEVTLREAIALAIAGDLRDGRPIPEPHGVAA